MYLRCFLSARSQKPDLRTIEPYDVSFAEIRSDEKWLETIQKVATAINVQFTDSSEQLPRFTRELIIGSIQDMDINSYHMVIIWSQS